MTTPAERLKAYARDLGFSALGITPASPGPRLDAYLRWVEQGMHGTMGYMAREDRVARRRDLSVILPGARSLIVALFDYASAAPPGGILTDPLRGRFSSYAWGADYHEILSERLERLASMLLEVAPAGVEHRVYVDTGAILERSHAEIAGLGFTGKNTMLISPQRGSSFFIGEIITTLDLAYNSPTIRPWCGTCVRCLAACPTGAFAAPYVLDARRCISYLTIEYRGIIPVEFRAAMGNWVYGCDICQEVCPWQRFSQPEEGAGLFAATLPDRAAPLLTDLLTLDGAAFDARFKGSAVYRIKRERLVRNACIAAGNSGDRSLTDYLIPLLNDPEVTLRAHAAAATGRLAGACAPLMAALRNESEEPVIHEIRTVLNH